TFRSARRVGLERHAAWSAEHESMPSNHFLWSARSFVRKAQYMFGWDWGPILISCGIWRPVELVGVPTARLLDWRYDVRFDHGRAVVRVETAVERSSEAPDVPLTLVAACEGAAEARAEVPHGSGHVQVSLTLEIEQPRRWSPGDPHLYPLAQTLRSGDEVADERQARIGLRTIELIHEPDPDGQGEGFLFRVNGEDHFCRGANWIPADSFPARAYEDEARLRPLLTAAREAGFTMLRVWGGGLCESEVFYDLCDELGLLVWQDFPYACAYYPDDARALEVAAAEATAAVRRLRVHPSLALWCGNNENQQMFHDNWRGLNPPRFLGQAIYDAVLPEVVAREDPGRPYWPGSAYGGANPNSPDFGDRHNWSVWHGQGVEGGDWPHYAEDRARFCSEFGFASSCGPATWDTCLAPSDRAPTSPAVLWHKKTGKPYDVYLGYIERHFPPVRSLDDLIYYSQLNQAEAMRFGVEHYRRLKGRCWGTLIWQLNDCWPVQSWSMIDYLGNRKAVYYAARRFYAPVLLSPIRQGGALEVHLVNDLLAPVSGQLTLRLASFDGTIVQEETASVSLGANGAGGVTRLSLRDIPVDPRDLYVQASLSSGERQACVDAITFLAEPKDLRLPDPQLQTAVEETDQGPAVTLQTDRFAAYVWLAAPGLGRVQWADNFFHLLPGQQHTVPVIHPPGISVEEMRERLKVRILNPS
ncbi:MAG: glycoside hydrolase family 2 protein, partial [Chloroflexi bacterium]|nr:glycoside hydrolase family 2 protein [Chloroflexota bacterium]